MTRTHRMARSVKPEWTRARSLRNACGSMIEIRSTALTTAEFAEVEILISAVRVLSSGTIVVLATAMGAETQEARLVDDMLDHLEDTYPGALIAFGSDPYEANSIKVRDRWVFACETCATAALVVKHLRERREEIEAEEEIERWIANGERAANDAQDGWSEMGIPRIGG